MSLYTDEPRFTIEQIDLLQRLRGSGMTKQEILHALDTLERLEHEHMQKFGPRNSYAGGTRGGGGGVNSHGSANSAAPSSSAPTSSSSASVATQTVFHGGTPSLSPTSYDTSPPPTITVPMGVVTPAAQNGRDGLAPVSNGKLSPSQYPVPTRAFSFEAAEEEVDIDDRVEELMRKDSNIIKEEIKAFLGSRRISQAVVAQVTGISQSRISHWLLQQGSDLSEQKKRAFYRWYQLEKTTPGATLAMRPAPIALEDIVEWHQSAPPINCSPGSFRLRRGSRFTWRKECLAVMESYFNDNQYPDEAKREEIANACNAVIQKPAILETHGIDVQSPGGHSNSDEIDGNDFSEPGAEPGLGTDESMGPSEHQDPISLAVEMAAVNHSILALSQQGRGGNDVKAEVLDDD
ncbi:homeobox-containing protein 1a isoform X6 [Neoarius graeffei]|uniref:homeobox-containing protein 1a isoform X6 n=1 Tax=Neoarius graeffei TaxID=443677 RepID=UPI00298C23C9|nr:homeobox-containing protein 1a isoform X6 [Neoarius graeffei]